jgi:glycosyltransferase involved in cell wall biosynthesis
MAAQAPRDFGVIARTIADLRPDLVYANTITLPHWVLGGRRARLPVVVHTHESDSRIPRILAAGLVSPLLASDRVIAVSQAAKQFLCTTIPRLRDRITVVYNGLEAPARDFSTPLASRPARLTVIGRLGPNKGQDVAVSAVQSLVDRGHDVELELVGDTFTGYEGFESDLRASVRQLGLDARVRFAGFQSDIWGVLADTDIVLAPSRTDSLPLVVIEAMLAGRPVIASAVGGMPELIDDDSTGVLVPPERPDLLADAVERLLRSPTDAGSLGASAREAAGARFGRERFRREIVGVVGAELHKLAGNGNQ